jgi:HPt (histidine-containing phosphotransfer) domain-containing protein
MTEPPLLDAQVLDDLTASIGEEGVRAVIALFLEECRDLTQTIARGDREAVRRAAHSLKSSAGQIGAAALSDAALAVERAAEAGATDPGLDIAKLQNRATRTEMALTEHLAR